MNQQLRPQLVALPIIAQCNYRCSFCEIVGLDKKLKDAGKKFQPNIMTVEHVDAFRQFIKTANVINLGGRTAVGEPLLSPNFMDIVKKIRDANPNVVIDLSTNGHLLTRDKADFLLAYAPVSLTFSIHAASSDVYDAVMGPGKKGRFEEVMKNIEYFCSEAKGKRVRTNINFGIGKLNHADAVKAVGMARRLGVDLMTAYLYYKSPNRFQDDVSLYTDVELANKTLREVYAEAVRLGQKMDPPTPGFIDENPRVEESQRYTGGCHEPYSAFLLKSDPTRQGTAAFSVCNRISPMVVDVDKLTSEDIFWAWHHPVINSLRLPNPKDVPPICKMCKDPQTRVIRSLDHEEYKRLRDKAVKDTLAPFQSELLSVSPSGAIRLLSDNIFSIDAAEE